MIKIKTPLRWIEDVRSGSVTLIADDGAVIFYDDSREVMPEWLDEIVRAVNAHAALVEALEQIVEEMRPTRPDWHLMISSEGQRMARAALALAKGAADG